MSPSKSGSYPCLPWTILTATSFCFWGDSHDGVGGLANYYDDFWSLDLSALKRWKLEASAELVPQHGLVPGAKYAR